MLDNDMIEFLTYRNAMKSNYRKGVHALRCILNNRKQAETFAGSLGGVSLVLGVSQPDGNSEALRTLLEGSAVIDQATLTWLKNWWPEQHHRNGPVPVGARRRKPRRGRQNSGWTGGPGQPEFCGDAGSSQLFHGDAGSSCLTGSNRSDLSERCGVVGSGFGGICGRDVLRRGQRCHGQGCGDPGGS